MLLIYVFLLTYVGGEEVQAELIREVLFEDDGAHEFAFWSDERWVDIPQLFVFMFLGAQIRLVQVESNVFTFAGCLSLLLSLVFLVAIFTLFWF